MLIKGNDNIYKTSGDFSKQVCFLLYKLYGEQMRVVRKGWNETRRERGTIKERHTGTRQRVW